MPCRAVRNTLVISLLALGLAAVPVLAANDEGCQKFDRKHTIKALGGSGAVHKASDQLTCDELATKLKHPRSGKETHWGELTAILADWKLGHLTDKLWSAIESCDLDDTTVIKSGNTLDWMTFRKKSGAATAIGPVCFDTKKDYAAFKFTVSEDGDPAKKPELTLTAPAEACVGEKIHLTASAGAAVAVNGQRQEATQTASGMSKYSYSPSGAGTYTFSATMEGETPKAGTDHTFVIPKVCLNLAYGGSKPGKSADPLSNNAQKSVMVKNCETKPTCSITVTPAEVGKKESVTVNVAVDGEPAPEVSVEVIDPKQASFATLTEFPATLTPTKNGVYKLSGTATNSAGSASCSAQFTVGNPPGSSRWTARFFGLRLDPDDEALRESTIRPNGVSERSHLHLDGGGGAGVELEYHFNERVGLAASALFAQWGSKLFFDLDDEWESAEADVDMLAFLIGPNFHLTPGKKVDVYIGPFIGIADLGSTSYRVLGETQRRSLDADTVFGAQLGVDIPFGQGSWAVHLGARYMDMSVEIGDGGPEIAADPLGIEAGFAYSF